MIAGQVAKRTSVDDSEHMIAGKTYIEIEMMERRARCLWYKKISSAEKGEAIVFIDVVGRAKTSSAIVALWKDAEYRASCIENNAMKRPEVRAKVSAALIGRPLSEETKAKLSAAHLGKTLSDETRAKISASLSGQTFSEEHRAKQSAAWTPEMKAKQSLRMTDRIISKETRARLSVAASTKWEDLEYRASHTGNSNPAKRPEVRAKMSAAGIERWQDSEYRARMSGEGNPNWRDGASAKPYSFSFTYEVREHIRNFCSRTCTVCGKSTLQTISRNNRWLRRIPVDHLYEDKMLECDDWACWERELTALCPVCHGRMNKRLLHILLQLLLLKNKKHQTNLLC